MYATAQYVNLVPAAFPNNGNVLVFQYPNSYPILHLVYTSTRLLVPFTSLDLVPRPSTPPVFDRLQYAKTEVRKAWERGYLIQHSFTMIVQQLAHNRFVFVTLQLGLVHCKRIGNWCSSQHIIMYGEINFFFFFPIADVLIYTPARPLSAAAI